MDARLGAVSLAEVRVSVQLGPLDHKGHAQYAITGVVSDKRSGVSSEAALHSGDALAGRATAALAGVTWRTVRRFGT